MNKIIFEQLNKLKAYPHIVDGVYTNDIPEKFESIIFKKNDIQLNNTSIQVIFEDYILKPFDGFDLHEKFNNGIVPYEKIMYGNIIKETEKMYYFNLHTADSSKTWIGWIPKKSCKII